MCTLQLQPEGACVRWISKQCRAGGVTINAAETGRKVPAAKKGSQQSCPIQLLWPAYGSLHRG